MAQRKEKISEENKHVSLTYEKIELVAKIAKETDSVGEAMESLEQSVGNDRSVQISTGTSIGLFLAAKGAS